MKVKISLDKVLAMVARDDDEGLCLACMADAFNVEPDTRRGVCESCGARAVYGAEELLIMGGI